MTRMVLSVAAANEADAAELASLHRAVADRLTHDYGVGHWSRQATERGVAHSLRTSTALVARQDATIVGTLRLAAKRPWAIDARYFAPVQRPVYLLDMAVAPDVQRRGIGRRLCEEALTLARKWPANAIRLDAYDHAAGAGAFYRKCGFREVGRVTYRKVPLIYFEILV